ncbi:J-type co-chaperone JAC1 [Escovopsis weberi]|uniref:J-type co-chaperone JAC1 n=1 Tax=Escovopsis weberi TaxID=150374 RepID=A0A0M9VRP4_ESCWE|nr:J-type co-chaperone JAC1 [Escovopsis weberi]
MPPLNLPPPPPLLLLLLPPHHKPSPPSSAILTPTRRHPFSTSRHASSPSPSPSNPPPPQDDHHNHNHNQTQPHDPLPAPGAENSLYDLFPLTLPHGPPPSGPFHINPRLLRREFLALQARAHPDLHPTHAKPRAEALSAHINHAYRTLAAPLPRAQYLLARRGLDLAGDEAARLRAADPHILELAMLAHEEIDDAESKEDIEQAKDRNSQRMRRCEDDLAAAFARDDVNAAVGEAVRLRYLVNIQTALDEWEPGKPVVFIH